MTHTVTYMYGNFRRRTYRVAIFLPVVVLTYELSRSRTQDSAKGTGASFL